MSFYLTVTVNYLRGDSTFVGLNNFLKIIKDNTFWVSVYNTVIFVVAAVFFEIIFGTTFALVFNSNIKGIGFLRPVILLPMLLPPITVALTWKMMYEYDYGVINYLLSLLGFPVVEWLSSTKWALFSIIITDVWQWTPFVFLIILASLQSIPNELYESASLEGANIIHKTRYITLPLLKPAITLVLLLRTIDTFQVFDKVYVLTGGGPGNATETITYYIYRNGFRYFETGFATAATIIMIMFVVVLSFPYVFRILKTIDFKGKN